MNSPGHKSSTITNTVLILLAAFMAAIIFIIDCNIPLGIAIGVAYSIVVFYSWIIQIKNFPLLMGVICSLLICIGFIYSPGGSPDNYSEGINRILSVVVIWVCVILVMLARKSFFQLEETNAHLEEKVRERTSKLQESEQKFRSLVESANDAIITADEKGTILSWNQTATKMFGWDEKEAIGESLNIIMPDKTHKMHQAGMERYLKTKEPRVIGKPVELPAIKKDKTEFPVELTLGHWQIDNKNFFCGIVRDITDRRESEEIEKHRLTELKNKNKELEQFAYIASHDLQEPLRTVSSFVTMFHKKYTGKLDKKADKYLEYIAGGTARMQALIKGLLDYTRIGRVKDLKEVNIDSILKLLKADLKTLIDEKKAKIIYKEMPTITCYPTEIKQLFQNLILNAIKFQQADTTAIVEIVAKKTKTDWEFSIKDNGIGISKEHQKKVFMIFQRLHTRNEYEGTGIGLAHCQKIVELHHGKLWIESVVGEGSTFLFTIPINIKKLTSY